MLKHGGGILKAAEKYNIPAEEWLDLSTGINPNGWPIPDIPTSSWQRLPEQEDGLIDAAKAYYNCSNLLPVAGSQAAIQVLPKLRQPCKVAVPSVGYAEHRHAWEQQGHEVVGLATKTIIERVEQFDVVLLINPNNPTGELITQQTLLNLHQSLKKRAGWLIVDEAFMDAENEHSLCAVSDKEGLIVLRSVGKFFGLAGIRAGFVLAEPDWLDLIEEQLGPWTVSGPTRWVCKQALADIRWQTGMRQQLKLSSHRLQKLLMDKLKVDVSGTALFQTILLNDAELFYAKLAKQGILVRLLDNKQGLRFGLPADGAAYQRLEKALSYP